LQIPWPQPAIAAVGLAIAIGWRMRPIGQAVSANGWLLTILIAAASSAVMFVVTRSRFSADPAVVHTARPNDVVIVSVVVILALVNSLGEELLWRGVLYDVGEESGLGPASLIFVQAVSFGSGHRHGIPDGLSGMLLAGFFAAALTMIRRRYGLGSSSAAHFVVDLVIFCDCCRPRHICALDPARGVRAATRHFSVDSQLPVKSPDR
jgi:membrane protease YdiL (CAAX protease family)